MQQYLKEPTNVTQKELLQLFSPINNVILTIMVKKGILAKYRNGNRNNEGFRYVFEAPEVTRMMADRLLEDFRARKKEWNDKRYPNIITRCADKPQPEPITKSNDWIPIMVTEDTEHVIIKIHKSIKIEKTKILEILVK